ncbi:MULTISPECIES: NAD(P)-dependent oxidoreductase [Acinetobacter calcoaceticus/baumannii complex]|uniref:NAD(P)-dependent oxidoreductase n=1 Tax=Acinetobacter calcoaceticus/baumannii complex TaxID=909768 RepID=UPI00244B9434|nr:MULTISPECIES: NAD(P)-dependent oxidoreductase [Acinetobacter calcoaceticus/baumannii complex]MDH2595946.1 NAD(P)-dependent oxidoreductase [Acinetobacter baumannii]MDO7536679.1 NAD(P)-dependent oxidoreductase [Acinetobacter pittii]
MFNITCAERFVLTKKLFNFDFPVKYTEYERLNQDEFEKKVKDQDVIILHDLKITETIIKNNPNLKVVALCSTGYDHIDLPLVKKHNIKVCNIRDHANDAVAEHAFILMINLIKNFQQQLAVVKNGVWSKSSDSFLLAAPIQELKGKTLVILGKGNIGLSLAEKAKAFGMKVIFSERKNSNYCRPGYTPFKEAIAQADILSLHCQLTEETRNIINLETLKLMKKTSILINVGRGSLINDLDLVYALDNKIISGFGADVLNQEPPSINHPLLQVQSSNVLITAHIAWATDEVHERLFSQLESNINNNLKGIDQNLI